MSQPHKMRSLSKKNIIIISIATFVVLAVGVIIFIFIALKSEKPEEQQNFYNIVSDENMTEESVDNEITSLYLQNINYEIIEVNEETGIAIVEVAIPDTKTFFTETIEEIVSGNEELSVDDLYDKVKEELKNLLTSTEGDKIIQKIELPVVESENGYVLENSEEVDVLIWDELETMYLESLIDSVEVEE